MTRFTSVARLKKGLIGDALFLTTSHLVLVVTIDLSYLNILH